MKTTQNFLALILCLSFLNTTTLAQVDENNTSQDPKQIASNEVTKSINDNKDKDKDKTNGIFSLKVYTPPLRTGIEVNKLMPLSLQDAINMVLEHNLDISQERNNIASRKAMLFSAKGFYDYVLGSKFNYSNSLTPTISALQGDPREFFTESYIYNVDVSRNLANGGSLKAEFNNTRGSTNNRFFIFDPFYISQLSFTYNQPLLKNFKINSTQRDIAALKKQIDIADLEFRNKLVDLVAKTQAAYYDLAFAIENEKIKRDAVELAAEQIRRNQVEVEAGRIAPVEVTAAEAEYERRKEEAISELLAITETENTLKNLIIDDPLSDIWKHQIIPTDRIEFINEPTDLEKAISLAIENRPELKSLDLKQKIQQVEISFLKNQQKPQLDFFFTFSTQGLAGAADRPNFFNIRPKNDLLGSYSTALKNIFLFRTYQFGVTMSLPLRNTTAKANFENALITNNQIDVSKKKMLNTIIAEVRNATQSLDLAAQSVESARANVTALKVRLDAEQVRFKVGMSTSFFVLEYQNRLSSARSRELRAITEHIKAKAKLSKVVANNLP
jgi:HAE1 family hydrophobic/amphiphilic exporter-1